MPEFGVLLLFSLSIIQGSPVEATLGELVWGGSSQTCANQAVLGPKQGRMLPYSYSCPLLTTWVSETGCPPLLKSCGHECPHPTHISQDAPSPEGCDRRLASRTLDCMCHVSSTPRAGQYGAQTGRPGRLLDPCPYLSLQDTALGAHWGPASGEDSKSSRWVVHEPDPATLSLLSACFFLPGGPQFHV